ncbi:putative n-acetylglucosaminyl-phosphatidylinositol de-n-acetylase [Diaporthe ampelina]|uniref:N-acetylglucosaminylphosphatidylinositol deacetylase n=1 Tax=Diaporthe ampelina TaxID=1214573 RepID=A0A0G2ICJ6_9PEZI|nr:putative n-acetylglucosaminyl-phosphatidylinositol de-n-acetylase [Diaporthe ampelina]
MSPNVNVNVNTNTHMLIMYPALTALGLVALLIPTLYLYTVGVATARFPVLRNRRVCLLIAHPDDEAMFFAPTVLALTRPGLGNHVKILCLSSGDAAGLGETRKRELVKSGLVLGLRRGEDVYVVDDDANFPDSMTTTWSTEQISTLLRDAFAPNNNTATPTTPSSSSSSSKTMTEPPKATIDVLITFDSGGISSHPNHISLYHGARHFVASLTANRPGWASPVDMYTLTSVGVARKYAGIMDVFATLGVTALGVWRGGGAGAAARRGDKDKDKDGRRRPAALVFMHGFGAGGWATAREAMTRAHVSQMVWFRWGWITISRYMFMNDLRLEKV